MGEQRAFCIIQKDGEFAVLKSAISGKYSLPDYPIALGENFNNASIFAIYKDLGIEVDAVADLGDEVVNTKGKDEEGNEIQDDNPDRRYFVHFDYVSGILKTGWLNSTQACWTKADEILDNAEGPMTRSAKEHLARYATQMPPYAAINQEMAFA